MDIGADVKTPNARFLNGLQLASQIDMPELVQFFLDAGTDMREGGGRYGSALQVAARHGSLKVVKLLLEQGAKADAEEGWFGNAINAASSYGHSDVVAILRDHTRFLPTQNSILLDNENIIIDGGQVPGYLKHSKFGTECSTSDGVDTEVAKVSQTNILPTRLTDDEAAWPLKIYDEGLEVEYTVYRDHPASACSDQPIPPSTQIYYFEVKALNRGNGYQHRT